MRIAIDWIKSNVVTVISIIVVLISLGFLIAVPQMRGKGALRSAMEDRAKKIDTLNGLISTQVVLPPAQPDAPPETVSNVTINEDVITKLQTLYNGLERQYNGVFETAVRFNSRHHTPMLDGLFPSWNPGNPDIPFLAREEYLRAFGNVAAGEPGMFGAYDPENPDAPRLDARMPPNREQLQLTLDQVQRDFVAADVTGVTLTEAEQKELERVLREKLIDLLRQRAESIHIYAQTDMVTLPGMGGYGRPGMGGGYGGQGTPTLPEVYPFQIAPWAFTNVPPQAHELWEGQLELWIQQDIVRAIGKANQIERPAHEFNVLLAPVKRLVSIQVVPGYVGLHTVGAAQNGTFVPNVQLANGAYPNPLGGQRTNNPDEKVSDNFYVGPTGRVSNALYDVRHVVLSVVMDYKLLPELINAFSDVNFMTVLNVQVQDIDEYQSLREGYMYGSADVVHAQLVVESVWLRQWTEPLMPDLTKSYVGIAEPTADAQPGMMPGMPGMYDEFGAEFMY